MSNQFTHRVSTADTNSVNVKNAAGVVYGYELANNSGTTDAYLKLYDSASAPTVGTDTPVRVVYVPKGQRVAYNTQDGLRFVNGISFGCVTGAADNSTTAVAAAAVVISIEYR